MKKSEKKMIFIVLVILIVTLIIFLTLKNKKEENKQVKNTINSLVEQVEEKYVEVQEDGTKSNKSDKLNQIKIVEGYTFSNIRFTEKNGETVLLADVKNNTSSVTEMRFVDITLINDQGEELVTITGIISPLRPGETKEFNTSMTLDYANAYDFKIIIK